MRTPGSVCLPLVCLAVSSWAATTSSAPARLAALKAEVEECHKKAVEVYMRGKWDALPAALKAAERQPTLLTPQQRLDLAYMRRTAAEFRPTWWNSCTTASLMSTVTRLPSKSSGFSHFRGCRSPTGCISLMFVIATTFCHPGE